MVIYCILYTVVHIIWAFTILMSRTQICSLENTDSHFWASKKFWFVHVKRMHCFLKSAYSHSITKSSIWVGLVRNVISKQTLSLPWYFYGFTVLQSIAVQRPSFVISFNWRYHQELHWIGLNASNSVVSNVKREDKIPSSITVQYITSPAMTLM